MFRLGLHPQDISLYMCKYCQIKKKKKNPQSNTLLVLPKISYYIYANIPKSPQNWNWRHFQLQPFWKKNTQPVLIDFLLLWSLLDSNHVISCALHTSTSTMHCHFIHTWKSILIAPLLCYVSNLIYLIGYYLCDFIYKSYEF